MITTADWNQVAAEMGYTDTGAHVVVTCILSLARRPVVGSVSDATCAR